MPPASIPSHVEADACLPGRHNMLVLSLVSFCLIGFGVWVFSAGKRYREEYAHAVEGWRVGSTRAVEVTVVREDRQNLACISDQTIAGLRCGGETDRHGTAPDPQILQPYNTVAGEILLGAGLWSSPDLNGPLPQERFTVVCNYHIKGVIKSATIRFGPTGTFAPLGRTTTVGTLTDCSIPR